MDQGGIEVLLELVQFSPQERYEEVWGATREEGGLGRHRGAAGTSSIFTVREVGVRKCGASHMCVSGGETRNVIVMTKKLEVCF